MPRGWLLGGWLADCLADGWQKFKIHNEKLDRSSATCRPAFLSASPPASRGGVRVSTALLRILSGIGAIGSLTLIGWEI